MDRIHWIREVVDYWQGPISLAVYVTSPREWIGLNILVEFYRKCNPFFRELVSIHVAIPVAANSLNFSDGYDYRREAEDFLKINKKVARCSTVKEFTDVTVQRWNAGQESSDLKIYYPQNQMRNIAKTVSSKKLITNLYMLQSNVELRVN
jgi:hypothetical protein